MGKRKKNKVGKQYDANEVKSSSDKLIGDEFFVKRHEGQSIAEMEQIMHGMGIQLKASFVRERQRMATLWDELQNRELNDVEQYKIRCDYLKTTCKYLIQFHRRDAKYYYDSAMARNTYSKNSAEFEQVMDGCMLQAGVHICQNFIVQLVLLPNTIKQKIWQRAKVNNPAQDNFWFILERFGASLNLIKAANLSMPIPPELQISFTGFIEELLGSVPLVEISFIEIVTNDFPQIEQLLAVMDSESGNGIALDLYYMRRFVRRTVESESLRTLLVITSGDELVDYHLNNQLHIDPDEIRYNPRDARSKSQDVSNSAHDSFSDSMPMTAELAANKSGSLQESKTSFLQTASQKLTANKSSSLRESKNNLLQGLPSISTEYYGYNILRLLEVVGELFNKLRLSSNLLQYFPEIDVDALINMRNLIAHQENVVNKQLVERWLANPESSLHLFAADLRRLYSRMLDIVYVRCNTAPKFRSQGCAVEFGGQIARYRDCSEFWQELIATDKPLPPGTTTRLMFSGPELLAAWNKQSVPREKLHAWMSFFSCQKPDREQSQKITADFEQYVPQATEKMPTHDSLSGMYLAAVSPVINISQALQGRKRLAGQLSDQELFQHAVTAIYGLLRLIHKEELYEQGMTTMQLVLKADLRYAVEYNIGQLFSVMRIFSRQKDQNMMKLFELMFIARCDDGFLQLFRNYVNHDNPLIDAFADDIVIGDRDDEDAVCLQRRYILFACAIDAFCQHATALFGDGKVIESLPEFDVVLLKYEALLYGLSQENEAVESKVGSTPRT